MKFEQTCVLFSNLSESAQREFFIAYRKRRDEDINAYIIAHTKQPRKTKQGTLTLTNKEENVKITFTDSEKLLLKKLMISMTEFKKLKEGK